MAREESTEWGTDVPISMPVPPGTQIMVNMGTFGFTEFGMAHNLTNADLEEYLPTFLPGMLPDNA